MNSQTNVRSTELSNYSSNLFVCLVAVFPALIAALLSAAVHSTVPFKYTGTDTEFASLTLPADNTAVSGAYTARGVIKVAAKQRHLYLAEESEGYYYPKHTIENKSSTWTRDLYAGAPAGTPFRLTVISVNTADNDEIINWFRNGESSGQYPGLSDLRSIEELTAVKLVSQ